MSTETVYEYWARIDPAPFRQGREARDAGRSEWDSPYQGRGPTSAWRAGWHQRDNELREERNYEPSD